MAVSSVNDIGNLVVFDENGSFIIPGGNKDLISQLRASSRRGLIRSIRSDKMDFSA